MGKYTIVKGDWLSKIAARYGMSWRELYEHPENAGFRKMRPDPDLIYPGDILWVPDTLPILPTEGDIEEIGSLISNPKGEPEEKIERMAPFMLTGMNNIWEYKVRAGETLESIAQMLGITWNEIAIINWGTDDQQEINWYLKNFVGCRSPNGAQTQFSGTEIPGTILLPKAVNVSGDRYMASIRVARREIE